MQCLVDFSLEERRSCYMTGKKAGWLVGFWQMKEKNAKIWRHAERGAKH